jgi:hypothetical protein
VTKRYTDWVRRIDGSRWTIGEITVDTDAETEYIGDPGVGSLVEAYMYVRADGSYLAFLISEVGGPESTPEPYEFSGVVQSIGGDRWTVAGTTVRIGGNTHIGAGIQVGDYVTVVAEKRAGGEIWAKDISELEPEVRQFSGVVKSINGSTWTVESYSFTVTGDTEITGNPGVGDYVDVVAYEYPDGSVIAKYIYKVPDVVPDTPTPTATAEPPTPTATAEPPTPTATAEPPTPTETAEPPTPTETVEPPTPTDTPEPPPPTDTPEPPTAAPTDAPTPEPPPPPPVSPEPGNTPMP